MYYLTLFYFSVSVSPYNLSNLSTLSVYEAISGTHPCMRCERESFASELPRCPLLVEIK